MDSKPQNPFALWTEFAFKLWGFGKPAAHAEAPEKQVAVAVIPTSDAEEASTPKRIKAKARSKAKRKSKRARR